MAKCRACSREASSNKFCAYHENAYDTLKKNYDAWQDAYGRISWKEYLERLLERKETGSWVKDVIMLELKEKRGV
jgi:hypothetical protein